MMSCTFAAACGGPGAAGPAPEDPFVTTPLASFPVGPLAGQNALLLTLGAVVAGDSAHPLPDVEARRSALLGHANAALDTAARRDAREVSWYGLAEQRRAARGAPTLALQPDNFATAYLVDRRLEYIPDPLRAQLRTLAAITGARIALAPTVLRVTHDSTGFTAAMLFAVVDARVGTVLTRGRIAGAAAPTAEAAIVLAAGHLIAPVVTR